MTKIKEKEYSVEIRESPLKKRERETWQVCNSVTETFHIKPTQF